MGIRFKNNAVSILTGSLTTLSTDILINASDDGKFPVIAAIGADYFYLTLEDSSHNIEVVKIVRHVSGSNNLETDGTADSGVNRGLDGTTARAWAIGDVVEIRLNAAALEEIAAALDTHIADTTAAHAASAISYAGSAGLSSTNVEAALDELDSEKQAAGAVAGGVLSGTYPNPSFAVDMATQAELNAVAGQTAGGVLSGTYPNPGLANGVVTEVNMAANAVNYNALKTATGDVSTTTSGNFALPGGQYGFYPQLLADAGASAIMDANISLSANIPETPQTVLYLNRVSGSSTTIHGRQRYMTASPPYDLGNGEIPLFVFAEISPSGQIMHAYCAPEAPWHNNGPTNISAEFRRSGKGYRRVKQLRAEFPSIKAARTAGLSLMQITARLETDPMVEIEITQAIKQADMPLIPHPFLNANPANTIVLLNPVANFTERLFRLHEGGESVLKLLHDGNIIVDNNAVNVNAPPGVRPVAARWKLTP